MENFGIELNFPDLGYLQIDLNRLEPSIMLALRNTFVTHKRDAEYTSDIAEYIDILNGAIESVGFGDTPVEISGRKD